MPRTKKQFEEMRNKTREKIQLAAMQLFVQKGYGSTNVQEISDLAGVSIGLLYRHYKTKEELFNELVEYSINGIKEVSDLFKQDDSPKKLTKQFINIVYNDMVEGDELVNLLMLMTQSIFSGVTHHVENEINKQDTEMLNATSNLIKRGQEIGEFRSGNPYELAVFLYSTIQGLATMKVMLKDSFIMPSPSIITAFLLKEGE